jgi:hypothetical protein
VIGFDGVDWIDTKRALSVACKCLVAEASARAVAFERMCIVSRICRKLDSALLFSMWRMLRQRTVQNVGCLKHIELRRKAFLSTSDTTLALVLGRKISSRFSVLECVIFETLNPFATLCPLAHNRAHA